MLNAYGVHRRSRVKLKIVKAPILQSGDCNKILDHQYNKLYVEIRNTKYLLF